MTFGQQSYNDQQQQLLFQYSCSSCGTILKETESRIDNSILRSLKNERCASCGSDLQEQTITIESALTKQQQRIHSFSPASHLLPITFERAFDLQPPQKLTFDIPQIDLSLDFADRGATCVTSSRDDGWHTNTLVTRACVRALMSRRQGSFESPSVIFIDAGNCSDIYECVDFARQYGLDIDKILNSIIVSRPFTIHQLTGLIVHSLQPAMKHYSAKLVVVSDVLSMFIKDPRIDLDEAGWLIKEIARTLKRLSAQAMIIVSISSSSIPPPSYAGALLRIFDSRIDMMMVANNAHSLNSLQLHVNNLHHSTIRMVTMPEKDLQLVPAR
jgi:Rad51